MDGYLLIFGCRKNFFTELEAAAYENINFCATILIFFLKHLPFLEEVKHFVVNKCTASFSSGWLSKAKSKLEKKAFL